MKICLHTIWKVGNYGAELQTYATVKVLRSLGHEVEVVNMSLKSINAASIRNFVTDLLTFCSPANFKFRKFWKKYIPHSRFYKNSDELKKSPPKADLYIVGSDQVWNPNITRKFKFSYFLDFVQGKKKVAYGSSFGISEWNESEVDTEKIKGLLMQFSAIGCREATGVKLLHDCFGAHAVNVIDPTLLHDGYDELTGPVSDKDSLVYYPLIQGHQLEGSCKKLADKLFLKFNNIGKLTYFPFTKNITWNRNSIAKWIQGIAEASFVVTQSFHGVCFSIIYRRNFAVVVDESLIDRISRVKDLLASLKLDCRIFYSSDDFFKSKIWETPINYDEVYEVLEAKRRVSIEFIRNIIK